MTVSWQGPQKREYYLDYLIKKYQWKRGIEVGVRWGRTLFHLLDHNTDLRMIAVDIDIGQFYTEERQSQYGERLRVLEGDSRDMAHAITEPVDFVFIDASHSMRGVLGDIEAYQKLLTDPRGLTGHDVDFPAVQAALASAGIQYWVGPDNVWHQKV